MIQRSPPTSSGDWSRPEERQSRNEIHNQLYLSESSPAEASERPFTETQASDEESSRGIVIAPGLCASCIETFDYLPTSDGAFTDGFQREMSDIEVAAKAGCPACAIFQANFGLFEDPRGRKMHGTVARVLLTMNPYFNFVSMLQPLSYTPARYFVRPAKGKNRASIENQERNLTTTESLGILLLKTVFAIIRSGSPHATYQSGCKHRLGRESGMRSAVVAYLYR